jgi:hypothetical protein
MADENPSKSPTGIAPDLPPIDVEATAPTAKGGNDSSIPIAAITPNATPNIKGHQDAHSKPHPHFKWHAEVLVDGHDMYQGIVKNISMKGLNLILEHNLQNSKLVKLHIHIPPPDISDPPHVLEVSGKITSTVYDNDEESFRSGISFVQFTLDSDQTYLQSLLS